MIKSYSKGYRAEWHLTHKLAELGYMVIRTPRSGRIGLPSPDIIAVKNGKIIVIECKSREEAFKIENDQLLELKQWQDIGGAIPYIGWKISRKDWKFMTLESVLANNGNVGKKFAESVGIGIDQI